MRAIMVVGVAAFLAIAASAFAASYTAKDFNMSFDYPAGWKLKEMKMPTAGDMAKQTAGRSATQRFGGMQLTTPDGFMSGGSIASQAIDAAAGTAQDTATAGIGGAIMEQQMKKMMPKFASVTLDNTARPGVQIMFSAIESGGGGGGTPARTDPSGGAGDSPCRVIEQRKTSWGGRPTTVMTMRCSQDGEFQYTMVASAKKDGTDFNLIGMMTSKSEDTAELNTYLKSAFDQIISSTRFN